MISKKNQELLLGTARETITAFLENRSPKIREKVPEELLENKGCFITLTKNGTLRGCIGSIQPVQPLWKEVQEKAVEAAFGDPRFSPLLKKELEQTKIEISVLTEPQQLEFGSPKELLDKLVAKKHGVILKNGGRNATFLPTVWEHFPDKQLFLSHLCLKAGLEPSAWQDAGTEILVYTTDSFKEE